MAVTFVSVKCPECGATISIPEGKKSLFCSYCGSQIVIQNDNEFTYRHVDDAEVKKAETEQLVYLKELELAEKDAERKRKARNLAYAIAAAFLIVGLIILLISEDSMPGGIMVFSAMLIAEFTFISSSDGNKRRTVGPNDVQISDEMSHFDKKNFQSVVSLFASAGFTNIVTVPLNDLNFLTQWKNGQVETVTIKGDSIRSGDVFKKADAVTITFHSMK